jgi:hypothetical protein
LFYPGVIGRAGGTPVVFALPKTYGPFINTQCGAKRALRDASQNAGSAELAAGDKVFSLKNHNSLR